MEDVKVGTPEPEKVAETAQPTRLSESQVLDVLKKSTLPEASQERLAEGTFETEEKLGEAITKEVAYVKKLTGSGKPFGVGDTKAPGQVAMSEKEREERMNGVFQKFGLGG